MLPITRVRAREGIPTPRLRRVTAAMLAGVLAAGLVTVGVASAATAAVTSYTSGGFTVGDYGPSSPSPVTITVPAGLGTLTSLSLSLVDPQHYHPADMVFDLRSPSGVQVRIGCNDGSTYFDDGSTCNSLAPFYGTDPAGTWELYPYDTLAFNDDPNTRYGGFTLTLDAAIPAAPVVTTDPQDATTTSGTTVVLSSAATGEPTPAAQWQVDTGAGFADLPGASTGPDYSFTPVFADSGNRYRVVYTNSEGDATSAAATLTVLALAPTITLQPDDTTVDSGSAVQLTTDASGDPTPTVQWERAEPGDPVFATLPGATGKTLTLDAVHVTDDGARYRAVYSNAGGDTATDPATLTVTLLAPVVTQNPSDTSVVSGDAVSLVADADSEVAETVQWQVSTDGTTFADLPGETSPTLAFAAAFEQDGYRYRAVFTNPAGSTATTAATLTVSAEGPSVTTSPADVTVEEGDPAGFAASASADPVATAQWQVSTDGGTTFTDVVGATLDTYTIPATSRTQHLDLYRAVFSNAAGEATTASATLQVLYSPEVTQAPVDATSSSAGDATFTADAAGTPTPTVQWQRSTDGGALFVDVAGAQSRTLDLSGLTFADSGSLFRAVFTNSVGSATTGAATLTVNAATTSVTTDIADQEVLAGTAVTFTAGASGDPAPSVQWWVSTDGGLTFADIDGATQDAYTFTAAAGDDGSRYVAVFTNAGGTDSTSVATLTVDVAPVVTGSPTDQTVAAGTRATFTSTAAGQPGPSVQWQVSSDGGTTFTDVVGATSPTFSLLAAQSADGTRYRAVYGNAGGQTPTGSALLTVTAAVAAAPTDPPMVTAPTDPLAVTGADSAVLALVAALLVAVGVAASVVGRRRRTTP